MMSGRLLATENYWETSVCIFLEYAILTKGKMLTA